VDVIEVFPGAEEIYIDPRPATVDAREGVER
jgi:hypothetical protein